LRNLKDEIFERCAKALQAGLSYYRGLDRGTRRGSFAGTFENIRKVYLDSLIGPGRGNLGPHCVNVRPWLYLDVDTWDPFFFGTRGYQEHKLGGHLEL
jgi:hypothetical protein